MVTIFIRLVTFQLEKTWSDSLMGWTQHTHRRRSRGDWVAQAPQWRGWGTMHFGPPPPTLTPVDRNKAYSSKGHFWKGAKFAGSVRHPMTQMLSASGGFAPLTPWPGALPLNPAGSFALHPRCRLVPRTRHGAPRPLTASAAYEHTWWVVGSGSKVWLESNASEKRWRRATSW